MNNERIKKLAEFFYHSNSAEDVPFRISITAGMAGREINKQEFKELLFLLQNSSNLYEDTKNFWEENYYATV